MKYATTFFLLVFLALQLDAQSAGLRYTKSLVEEVVPVQRQANGWKNADFAPCGPPKWAAVLGPILSMYEPSRLPMFCRLEVQMEKSSGLPIKMRLGSVDYVDMLERKRSSGGY